MVNEHQNDAPLDDGGDIAAGMTSLAECVAHSARVASVAEVRRRGRRRTLTHRTTGAALSIVVAAALAAVVTHANTGSGHAHPVGPPSTTAPAYRAPLQMTVTLDPDSAYYANVFGVVGHVQRILVNRKGAPDTGAINVDVAVHDPGTYDPAPALGGEHIQISGHDAYKIADMPTGVDAEPADGGPLQELRAPGVAWMDPSGAWVVVTDPGSDDMNSVQSVAAAVHLGPPRDATAPATFGYIPPGLTAAGGTTVTQAGAPSWMSTDFYDAAHPVPERLVPDPGLVISKGAALEVSVERGSLFSSRPGTDTTIAGHPARYGTDTFDHDPTPGLFVEVDANGCATTFKTADTTDIPMQQLLQMAGRTTYLDCTKPDIWKTPQP